MNHMDSITERIRADFVARNDARNETLHRTRELIRLCATAIRCSHRNEWAKAYDILNQATTLGTEISESISGYPDLLNAGYTQDALKELVEAHATLALAKGDPIPEPESLGVIYPTYLNGLCEAASEMRRRCLDEMRRDNSAEAERLLSTMDDIYDVLGTFDFPDAITGGLRRRVDQLRGVLERTRGDVTNSLRQDRLLSALGKFEKKTSSK